MAIKTFKYFDAGVGFKDQAADNITSNGVIYRNGTKLKAYIENAARELITTSQTQTLTNKTIDGSLNTVSNIPVTALTSIIDTDLNAVSASHDTIPSAKATKDYVDQQILTEDAANEIEFTPAGTIVATNVQAAVEEVSQDVTDHLNDSADAHTASAITNIPSGNLLATDAQSALNELQSDIDNRATSTDLSNHINDITDAHDASAISNIPSGNLAATDMQSAVDELQSDIDNRALSTNGSIITPARLDFKQDTYANLVTYASTASDGQAVYATDTDKYYGIVNNALISLGGGGSGLSTIFQLTADELINTWSTGNNASFLGGGALAGTFVYDTVAPLHGTTSYKYTQAAGSLNDYIASAAQSVDSRFRGNIASFSFAYKYDGLNVDIEPVIYDVTNSTKLNSTADLLSGISTTAGIYKINVTIPLSCTSIRVGFQVKALNSGKILQFDDLQLSADATVYADPSTITEHQNYTPTITGFGTVSSVNIRSRKVGSNLEIIGTFVTGTPDGSAASLSFPTGLLSSSNISALENAGSVAGASAATNRLYVMTRSPSTSIINFAYRDLNQVDTLFFNGTGTAISSGSGQILQVNATIPIQGWSASNPQIITPADQISSDTLSFIFKATAIDPATDAIGTFNTYTYAAGGNTPTIAGTAPTQTTNSMNINGVQLFGRGFNATSNSTSPARVDVFIGKGLKNYSLNGYESSAKVNGISFDNAQSTDLEEYGITHKYDETTGILSFNAARALSGLNTTRYLGTDNNGLAVNTSAYFVFNAAKSPSLVSHPSLIQRIATLSDEKANNTDGGTSIAGWNTRDLNTENDPDSIVSLSANQFTLQAGRYYIVGRSPVLQGDRGKVRLRNITLGTTALVGESFYVPGGSSVMGTPEVKGTITITSATVFELQHYLTTGVAGVGLGYSTTSAGEVELYSTVEITQLK